MQSERSRRKIAHTELWAWADEVCARSRFSAIGITVNRESKATFDALRDSIEEFLAAIEREGWQKIYSSLMPNEQGFVPSILARLLELEVSAHIPKHVELTDHRRSGHPLDGQLADAQLSSLRRDSRGVAPSIEDQDDEAWRSLELRLPDEWSDVDVPLDLHPVNTMSVSFESGPPPIAIDESMGLETELLDAPMENEGSLIHHLLDGLSEVTIHRPSFMIVDQKSLSYSDFDLVVSLLNLMRSERANYPLLMLWIDPSVELDDLITINLRTASTVQVGESPIGMNDSSIISILDDRKAQDDVSLDEILEETFRETFNQGQQLSKSESELGSSVTEIIDHSIDLDKVHVDPDLLMQRPLPSFDLKEIGDHRLLVDVEDSAKSSFETTSHRDDLDNKDEQELAEQTTSSLAEIKSSSKPSVQMIERGNFKDCHALVLKKYGELAPILLVAAASGPTCTVGQMATLWRAVIERPLQELTSLSEVIWEGLSLTLERGLLVSTQHQRFSNEQSFRFNQNSHALKWRERWEDSVSLRLRRRAHRSLALWMMRQPTTTIARPQVALTIMEHWIEAGEAGEVGHSALEAAKMLIERGDSSRAKRTLQRAVQVLGPEGSWESWRECLELLLKLNLEEGDELAVELVSKQLIDRAWRIGDVSLVKRLGITLERVYKTTGRIDEAQRLGEWSACQPLVDPTAALFDQPVTMFPTLQTLEGDSDVLRVVGSHPTLFADVYPPEDIASDQASELMPIPEIHTLEAPPPFLLEALLTLRENDFEAFVVGGSVRDRLLGRQVNDWDLTTSALPQEVISCFSKVIETGIEHGTVTVILEGEHVEITTYRLDGEYRDGRRPDQVAFTRSLAEDLLRRDFTINAIAWDPINAELQDPYSGVHDLQLRLLRAVGDPKARFQEDGLRVLRLIRFATTLDFSIDPETERGAIEALEVLKKVAIERIQVELFKTLMSDQAAKGLSLIRDFGLSELCFPCLPELGEEHWGYIESAISICEQRLETRLALIFYAAFDHHQWSKVQLATQVKETLKGLKASNQIIQGVLSLVAFASLDVSLSRSDAQARALGVEIGPSQLEHLSSLKEAWLSVIAPREGVRELEGWRELHSRLIELKIEDLPQSPKDLSINGNDLCEALDLFPSRAIGELLSTLLWWVWEEPKRDQRETLIDYARGLAVERGLI